MSEVTQTVTRDYNALVAEVNGLLEAGEPGNISFDTYGDYSGYDPQFLKDTMNKVFGVGKWWKKEISSEVVKDDKGGALVVAKVEVWLAGVECPAEAWGQNRVTKGDVGDARKGAATDAMKKALSDFSIGNRAYLGLLPSKKEVEEAARRQSTTANNARAVTTGNNNQQQTSARPAGAAASNRQGQASRTEQPTPTAEAPTIGQLRSEVELGSYKNAGKVVLWKDVIAHVFAQDIRSGVHSQAKLEVADMGPKSCGKIQKYLETLQIAS